MTARSSGRKRAQSSARSRRRGSRRALPESKSRWNLLAQGTVMAHVDEKPGPGERYWTDGWSGYPAARERLFASFESTRVRNPVCLSGDIHAFLAAKLNRRASDPDSPVIATEFVTSSISSQGVPMKMIEERLRENPSLLAGSSRHRGYLRLDLYRDRAQVDMVAMDTVIRTRVRHQRLRIVHGRGRPPRTPCVPEVSSWAYSVGGAGSSSTSGGAPGASSSGTTNTGCGLRASISASSCAMRSSSR